MLEQTNLQSENIKKYVYTSIYGFPRWYQWLKTTTTKNSPANAGDMTSRFSLQIGKIPWNRKWQLTPVSSLENPMDRGAWSAAVHGVTKGRTRPGQLSMHAKRLQNKNQRFDSVKILLRTPFQFPKVCIYQLMKC